MLKEILNVMNKFKSNKMNNFDELIFSDKIKIAKKLPEKKFINDVTSRKKIILLLKEKLYEKISLSTFYP